MAMFAIEQRHQGGRAIVGSVIYHSNYLFKTVQFVLLAGVVFAASTRVARAQLAAPDLANATLEELMNIRVTSAARKSQRAEDVPAAIYVITGRDIRQSGLTTLPEILRLAPGVQVAQVSASKWAVSIRGFNSPVSNKLLVLIDGRSVYSRAFSGVFWDLNEVMVVGHRPHRGHSRSWRRRLGCQRRQRRHLRHYASGHRAAGPGPAGQRRHLRARRHGHPVWRDLRQRRL